MIFISLYFYLNLSCNCTLSEHAIKSQVHMIQCSETHTWLFHRFFHRVFHRQLWYTHMWPMIHSTMIQQHVSNVTCTLWGIIWYNKNSSTFDFLSSTYYTISCIKCYMYQNIQCIKCTYLFPGFYAKLRRVTFLEIIS